MSSSTGWPTGVPKAARRRSCFLVRPCCLRFLTTWAISGVGAIAPRAARSAPPCAELPGGQSPYEGCNVEPAEPDAPIDVKECFGMHMQSTAYSNSIHGQPWKPDSEGATWRHGPRIRPRIRPARLCCCENRTVPVGASFTWHCPMPSRPGWSGIRRIACTAPRGDTG